MPEFSYQPMSVNDKSSLSEGWHPAFLVAITDEPTPETWQMFKASPRLWRWQMAVWESPDRIGQAIPEHQSAPSSQKFSPGGRYQAAKAYVWTCELLGRRIQAGERVSLDALMPLPCRVKITRRDKLGNQQEYANITDLEKWPDGAARLTPDVRQNLLLWWAQIQNGAVQVAPTASSIPTPMAPPAVPPVQPGMQSWAQPVGTPATSATQAPAKAGW